MTTSAQRLNRAALARAVKEEQRRLRASALAQLRTQIAGVHQRRRELVQRVVAQCRRARARVKERIAARRIEVKAALEREVAEMKQAESESTRDRLRREARQRRRDELALQRIERHRSRELAKHRKAERQKESDDDVRSNIDDELVPVFNVVKARVRARPGMSRTEAFLHWIEENPSEVWALREDLAEKRLRALIREEQEAARALRKVGGRSSAKARRAALEPAPF